jgi:hypothetical protein
VLMIKFDNLKKSEYPFFQTETSDFYSDKMVNISKLRPTLYISQVVPCKHIFRLCTCFSDNLVEFHSRNK